MSCEQIIRIDGLSLGVGLVQIERHVDVLDKMARRTINGDLRREILGVYFNYKLTFGEFTNMVTYSKLFDKLTEKKEFHIIQIPSNLGYDTYTGYIAKVSDTILYVNGNDRRIKGLTCEFVAKKPRGQQ